MHDTAAEFLGPDFVHVTVGSAELAANAAIEQHISIIESGAGHMARAFA